MKAKINLKQPIFVSTLTDANQIGRDRDTVQQAVQVLAKLIEVRVPAQPKNSFYPAN